LIAGKDYGSEGTAQRYLCALLINGPQYGYHKSWPLSERGVRFVAGLYSRAFGTAPADPPEFWNEMNLLAVNADDKQAVDYAFLWRDVSFLVELKTLGGSHRPGQLAEYLLRARHHNPEKAIDLLYLTQSMSAASPDPVPERCRYAHITWSQALDVADDVWGTSADSRELRCLVLLRDHLQGQGALAALPVRAESKGTRRAQPPADLPEVWRRLIDRAVVLAERAAAGQRAAIDVPAELVADPAILGRLEQVKVELEKRITASEELSGVKVWRWTSSSGGRAYTEAGGRVGLELRLSPPSS
jgi:hypothetical protein